ncbi:lysostaphin resistance A-like protein [Brachybacterium sp. AOP43-C2-M15]|uniref:lysostaphin resistance A-like protein n=1 Tax=Brachybacterium sp. AOP43-C2-M15 TaxID=3457661 RepID=UPI0040331FFF
MDTETALPRSEDPAGHRPRLPAWARTLLTVLLMPPAALAAVLPGLIPGAVDLAARSHLLEAAVLGAGAATSLGAYLLFAALLIRRVDRRSVQELGLRPDGAAALALLAGIGISMVVALLTAAVAGSLPLGRTLGEQSTAGSLPSFATTAVVVLVQAFVLQGIGEEVLFRGYLLQSLRRRPVLAVVVTACAFALPHLLSSGGQQNLLERVVFLAIPFGFALSAGILGIALRSVWAPVGIHGGFHLSLWIVTLLGFDANGPGVWLLLGALHVLAALLIAVRLPRSRWTEVRERGPYAR